ncbi:MAG: radical SAM protein [Firmicutes bacterium]|nr:radical SAM protein [Bacillota bacterium]
MKKIVLIEPKTRKEHVFSTAKMPRLGLPLLGTQLKNAGYKVHIYLEAITDLPWSDILDADLVGISTTTSTSQEAYRLASFIKSHQIPVVIGGIHATFVPEEALQYGDYVVRGEADFSFLPLVRALEKGEQPVDIPGVSFLQDGVPVHNPCRTEAVDLNELPIPDLNLFVRKKISGSIPVMTSRGCPFNCSFCCVTAMFGRKYRYRNTNAVLDELSLYQGKNVFFCDDNFTDNYPRTKELLQGMLDRKIKLKGWGAQVRVEAAKNDELLDLMRRTGAKIVYIGLESINPATLKAYNKRQSVEDIRNSIRRFHDYGIRVHGMFVFGSDEDTVQTIRETVDFALETRIDSVQFMMLTPLPGTPLFEKLESEGRLLTKDWELYDGHHVVFQPAQMSPEELQEETVKAMKRFYSLRHVFQNAFLTGWGSVLYRGVGWFLVRRFEKHNRWYDQILDCFQKKCSNRTVPLFYRRLQVKKTGNLAEEGVAGHLKIYVSENNGTFYLTLRGLLDRLTVKELSRHIRDLLPKHCFHLVVNTEGLSILSEKAADSFTRLLNRLGKRVRRIQLIYKAEENNRLSILKKFSIKLPRFELVPGKR